MLSIGFCSPCVLVSLRYACGPRAAQWQEQVYTGACLEKQVYIWAASCKSGVYIQATPLKKQVYIWATSCKSMACLCLYVGHLALYMGHLLRNQVYIGATSHRSRSIYGQPCK